LFASKVPLRFSKNVLLIRNIHYCLFMETGWCHEMAFWLGQNWSQIPALALFCVVTLRIFQKMDIQLYETIQRMIFIFILYPYILWPYLIEGTQYTFIVMEIASVCRKQYKSKTNHGYLYQKPMLDWIPVMVSAVFHWYLQH
jgi:hypothetical protein